MKALFVILCLLALSRGTLLAQSAPFAHTQAATPVAVTNVALNGMVVPNGLPTTAWFEWGAGVGYDQSTAPVAVGSGTAVVRVSVTISNLPPGPNFRSRLVASNALGAVAAYPANFTTGQRVTTWGDLNLGLQPVPPGLSNVVAISAGYYVSLALKSDRTVAAWGSDQQGLIFVPTDVTNVVAVEAGESHELALRADGSVAAWGQNNNGQTNVPPGLSNVIAVSAGFDHSVALRANGTVVAWGRNEYGQANVPSGLSNVVEVAAGHTFSVALLANGSLVVWGEPLTIPSNLTNVVRVALGPSGILAIRVDGSLFGTNNYAPPPGLPPMIAVSCGTFHATALDVNGQVHAWGSGYAGLSTVPPGLSNAVAAVAGNYHAMALGNLPPQAQSQTKPGLAGQDVIIGLQGSDPNSDFLNYRIVTLPLSGTLYQWTPSGRGAAITSPGTAVTDSGGRVIFYLPSATNAGFTFLANDGWADSSPAQVALEISPSWVFTQHAHPGGNTGVTLRGSVSAAVSGWSWFEWGAGGSFTQSTAAVSVPGDLSVVRIMTVVSNLAERANFQCRMVVSNQYGLHYGMTVPFTTGRRAYGWGNNSNGQTNPPASLTNAIFLAAGENNSFALRSDGTPVGWGWNSYGQATPPPELSNAVDIAAGYFHSVGLKPDGTVIAWANNVYEQTNVPAGLSNVVDVAAGYAHSFALRADGSVQSWGTLFSDPNAVPADLTNAVAISGGRFQNLALRADGTVVVWDGSSAPPADLVNVAAIAAGATHNLALRRDGTVVAWGANNGGQTSVPASLSNVVAVAAGLDRSLALKADGSIVAWGALTTAESNTVASVTNAVFVAIGGGHSLALGNMRPRALAITEMGLVGADTTLDLSGSDPDNDPVQFRITSLPSLGSLYQWTPTGRGDLMTTNNTPVQDPGGRVIFAVASPATNGFTYVANDGLADSTNATASVVISAAWAVTRPVVPSGTSTAVFNAAASAAVASQTWFEWGLVGESFSQATAPMALAGDGSLLHFNTPVTNLLPRVNYQCRVVVSNGFGLVFGAPVRFTAGRSAVAWGQNTFGQATVPVGLSNLVAVAAGGSHSVGLRADGTVVAWGRNNFGQTNIPAGLANVAAISAGDNHSLALRSNGTVIAWGSNASGQTNVPAGLTNVVAVSAGAAHNLALKRDGTLVAWGASSIDQVVNVGQTNIPAGLSHVAAIGAGGGHNMVLKVDGTVLAWGYNLYGQTNVPAGLRNVVAIAAGRYHSLALKADGTIADWGVTRVAVPASASNIVAIAAGNDFSVALRSDGIALAWGVTGAGQSSVPAALHRAVAISSGGDHSLALGNLPPVALNRTNYGAANKDSVFTLTGTDVNGDGLTYRVTTLPAAGALFQWTSFGRGAQITAPATPVTDSQGRVIFAPATGGTGWPYTTFSFLADDGESNSAPATATVNITPAPVIQVSGLSVGPNGFSLSFSGDTNASYRVWGSTNLADWLVLGSPTQSPPGFFSFTDFTATNWPLRFYRVTCP